MDLLNPAFPHRAFYNDDGDIILPSFNAEPQEEAPILKRDEEVVQWIIVDEDPADLHAVEAAPEQSTPKIPLSVTVREQIIGLRQVTRSAVREGARQYKVSIESGAPILRKAGLDMSRFFSVLWDFLAQPVWVPGRKKTVKQYSRGTLFLLDILRFGGTFTAIFLVLFLALNYQSFWQITEDKVAIFLRSPSINTPESEADNALIETLKASATDAHNGRERGELLSFLPTVGPPDNRLLIPKLHLNVPLVEPPTDALLRQDWNQVETDIQASLAEGVVHYPGTARPGQAGNFFVTGHSSYYPWAPGLYKTVFARLQNLNVGDEYWAYYKGDQHRYVVIEKKEVSPSDITVLDQPENKRISTLMTCTPVGTTLRRLIIKAQEVDPLTGKPLQVGEKSQKEEAPKLQLEALPI